MKASSAKAILIAVSLLFPSWSFAQTKSKDAAAYANRGFARLRKSDLDGAIADFNRALQFDPKLAKAYLYRGIAKAEKLQWEGAMADFNRALQLDPKLADAYYSRGLAKRKRHELIVYGAVGAFIPGYDLGARKIEKGDLKSAMADFNRALQLNPKDAKAFDERGITKIELGDLDGAIADFNRALQFNPKLAEPYETRALAKQQKGELDAAIVDYNRALELNPRLAGAYVDRGSANLLKGDAERAIADFNRALELNPKLVGAYQSRDSANFLARRWTSALQDYERSCELWQRDQEYPRLAIWMIRARLGEREAADKELATHFNAPPGSWASKIQAYLLGNLSETEFVAAAASRDTKTDRKRHCEAWFYAGMKNLLNGNRSAASEFFKKCLATEGNSVIEYQFAKAELHAMGQ